MFRTFGHRVPALLCLVQKFDINVFSRNYIKKPVNLSGLKWDFGVRLRMERRDQANGNAFRLGKCQPVGG